MSEYRCGLYKNVQGQCTQIPYVNAFYFFTDLLQIFTNKFSFEGQQSLINLVEFRALFKVGIRVPTQILELSGGAYHSFHLSPDVTSLFAGTRGIKVGKLVSVWPAYANTGEFLHASSYQRGPYPGSRCPDLIMSWAPSSSTSESRSNHIHRDASCRKTARL